MRAVLWCLPCVVVGVVLSWGPVSAAAQDSPSIGWGHRPVNSVDGQVLYTAWCSSCHGPTGRGNGPAAKHLSVPVPDLSTIAVRDGKFNFFHVQAHVTSERVRGEAMPCWRDIIARNYRNDEGRARMAVTNLVRHVESLQVVRAAGH
jgi:hypothetical protein